MNHDVRLPLGLTFLITGLLLAGYGASTRHSGIYAASEGVNLNLIWGAVMALFGGTMVVMGRKGQQDRREGSSRSRRDLDAR